MGRSSSRTPSRSSKVKTGEIPQLNAMEDSDEINISSIMASNTVLQLKQWLTYHDVDIPSSKMLKKELAKLVVEALEDASGREKKSSRSTPAKRALTPPAPATSDRGKRRKSNIALLTPLKKEQQAIVAQSVPAAGSTTSFMSPALKSLLDKAKQKTMSDKEEKLVQTVIKKKPKFQLIEKSSPRKVSTQNEFQSGSGGTSQSRVSSRIPEEMKNITSSHLSKNVPTTKRSTAAPARHLPARSQWTKPRIHIERPVIARSLVPQSLLRFYNTLRFYAFSLFFVIALALFLHYYVFQDIYCDSGKTPFKKECMPCPDKAKCAGGRAVCPRGLILRQRRCVDDPRVLNLADRLCEETEDICGRRSGVVQCDAKRSPKYKYISETELVEELKEFYDDSDFNHAWGKCLERIKSGDHPVLHHSSQLGIWSNTPILSLKCRVRQWLISNWWAFALVSVGIIGIFAYYRYHIRQRKRREQASLIFKKTLVLLKNSAGPYALELLYEGAFEEAGLPKNDQVWAMALDLLARDARISNALANMNGTLKRGLLFTHTPTQPNKTL